MKLLVSIAYPIGYQESRDRVDERSCGVMVPLPSLKTFSKESSVSVENAPIVWENASKQSGLVKIQKVMEC